MSTITQMTCAQRQSLKAIYRRCPLYPSMGEGPRGVPLMAHHTPMSYRDFRKYVAPGPGCIMVKWCGMWLGIEGDGYAHS